MSEPMWLDGDDVALYGNRLCDECDEYHDDDAGCGSSEPDPDEMHDSWLED